MASIFLANAPYFLTERYGKLAPLGATLPHLGLLMLAAVLRRKGHTVRILDASAQGLGYEQTIKEMKRFRPDLVALTSVTPSIGRTVQLASMIKAYDSSLPVILGGPHITAVPKQTLMEHSVFDYGVLGEGEDTIVEFVEAFFRNGMLSKVPGLAYKKDNKILITPARQNIKDLDTLPFPAWDLLDGFPAQYRPAIFKYKRLPATHIVSSRGCPQKCIFCDTSVFSRHIRFHSPEYILDMVGYLVKKFGIREVIFEDDQFLVKRKRVEKFCRGLLKSKWNISWCCSARVDSVDDPEVLGLMKRSGCWQISYGIESGNQGILDFAKKAITINQIERAVRLTHEAGILSKGYFIYGLPFETEKTMENTIRFAKGIPLNDMSVFILTPFPGSEMYDIAEKYGVADKNFDNMNLLEVVYVPKNLTKKKLLYYQRRFMREFYLRPRIIGNYVKRLFTNPRNFFHMVKAFWGFSKSVFRISN